VKYVDSDCIQLDEDTGEAAARLRPHPEEGEDEKNLINNQDGVITSTKAFIR
jgi:hypothetical protein